MNILITTPIFYPDTDGVAEVVYRQYLYLISRGHKVKVITGKLHGNVVNRQVELLEVTRLNIQTGGFPRYAAGDLFGVRKNEEYYRYLRLLEQSQVDIILTHSWQTWNTDWLFDSCYLTDLPVVLFSHGTSVNTRNGFLDTIRCLRWQHYASRQIPRILKKISAFCVLEDHVDDDRFYDVLKAKQLGINVVVVPNGFSPELTNLAITDRKDNQRNILCVSQYMANKDPKSVIQAFVQANPKNWNLLVCGSQKTLYAARLERSVKKYSQDLQSRIKLYYGLNKDNILSLYRNSDIFISASKTECQPLVLIDAMGAGIPFITTKVGCVHKLAGGIVINNVSSMASVITEMVNNPVKRQRLGQDGLRAANEKYNWNTSLPKLEFILKAVYSSFRKHIR